MLFDLGADVTIGGILESWLDSQNDDAILTVGNMGGRLDVFFEDGDVFDVMIGGKGSDDGLRINVLDNCGGIKNRHGSISFERFGDYILSGYFLTDMAAGSGEVFLVGDKEDLGGWNDFLATFDGLL